MASRVYRDLQQTAKRRTQEKELFVKRRTRARNSTYEGWPRMSTASRTSESSELHIAPKKAVDDFLDVLRPSPSFRAATALRPEDVAAVVADWEMQWNLNATIHTASYMKVLAADGSSEVRRGEDRWTLREEAARDKDPDSAETGSSDLQLVHVKDRPVRYRVQPRRLSELDFETLSYVEIEHPLNRQLDHFEGRSRTLTEILEELCDLAGADFAVDAGRSDLLRLTHRVRGRSILECLEITARVVGWRVAVNGARRSPLPPNQRVTLLDLVKSAPTDLRGADPGSGPTPAQVLEDLLHTAARRLQGERYVVTLTRRFPTKRSGSGIGAARN